MLGSTWSEAFQRGGQDGKEPTHSGADHHCTAYVRHYLSNHPQIHQGMTLLVRQLQPGAQGLPLEIYCFSNDTNWENYEGIHADIFDHLIASLPEFGLRAFQEPAGSDLKELRASG